MNENSLIIVADAARARIFRIVEGHSARAPVELQEIQSLVHPEARVKENERYAGSFAAGVRAGKVGQTYALDDHRGAHDLEERRRFARQVAVRSAQLVRELSGNPVIVVATHAVHSLLSSALLAELPREVHLRSELGEFTERPPHELLAHLEARGVFSP
jgi:hypothetical protein